ncbi:hypothetical protein DPX16_0795 [Anabarilius grahami]|uniref:Uncharacterized protein n=1 Tax=Anabarilius grahami TaxID=495550 RepID=A0A3N0Z9H7_ANAGA|nr:hypothetical protein DPX16_0795 [Anabarilius grahami]
MGLFLVSEIPVSPVPPKPCTPSDRLCGFLQDGRSLERYVEEFVELAYLANWPDAPLNGCFLAGLDENTIRFKEPACYFSLVEAINLTLFLNCSKFVIEEVLDKSCYPRSASPETQVAWPVRQSPFSSAYPSSERSSGVLPDPNPPMANEKSSAGPRRPKKKIKKAAKRPQSPEFSASVQPQFPEFSAAEQPELHVKPAASEPSQRKDDWFIDFFTDPAPSPLDHAPVLTEPAPVPVGLLIDFEGMDWTPFPDPSPALVEPAPALTEPSPATAEPAPALAEPAPAAAAKPAPATAKPAPTAAEPTPAAPKPNSAGVPTSCHEPFQVPLSLPKKFFWGGRVPVGGKDGCVLDGGGLGDLPWQPTAPDPPWPSSAPDQPWPPTAPDLPWPSSAPDTPCLPTAPDPPWPSTAPAMTARDHRLALETSAPVCTPRTCL